jgi:hypothetical protein
VAGDRDASDPGARKSQRLAFADLTFACLLAACDRGGESTAASTQPGDARPSAVDAVRLRAAGSDPRNWMTHGRTYNEQRFSPPAQIASQSVDTLGLAWHHDWPPDPRFWLLLGSVDGWRAIVHDGTRGARGMVGFGAEIDEDGTEALRAFEIRQAHDTKSEASP